MSNLLTTKKSFMSRHMVAILLTAFSVLATLLTLGWFNSRKTTVEHFKDSEKKDKYFN